MDIQSIEYKCFRICIIHLTCQSLEGGGGTLADSKLKSVFQQKFPFLGGGVHRLTQNLNLSLNKNFHSGGGGVHLLTQN